MRLKMFDRKPIYQEITKYYQKAKKSLFNENKYLDLN